jgi:hypothetical protein
LKNKRPVRSYEYTNEFLYIILRQAPEEGPRAYLYCSGINISRFDPICWGKAGICSNPAFRGLQLLRADVTGFSLKLGVKPKYAEHLPCVPISPKGDGWYRENILIDNASPKAVRQILEFSVMDLMKRVLAVCAPDAKLPKKLPTPSAMRDYLESLSVVNYKTQGF